MPVSRREMLAAGAAALPASALFLTSASGQTTPATGRAGGTSGAAGGAMPPGRDPLLAACLLVGGRRQIEACQFAMEKLQNEDCKNFAKAEIEEHETIKAKLKEFGLEFPAPAGGATGVGGTGTGTSGAGTSGAAGGTGAGGTGAGGTGATGSAADRTGGTTTGSAPDATGGAGPQPLPQVMVGRVMLPGGASEFVHIEVQVGEQCIQNYKKKMSEKQGVKFDKAFVGDQLHTHMGLLDKVQVFQRHASPPMRQELAKGEQIIRQHIATCEQLMEKLDQMKDERRGS